MQLVRSLLGTAWMAVEVQGGKLFRRSRHIQAAWTAGSLIVRGATGESVVLCVSAPQTNRIEHFSLGAQAVSEEFPRRLLATARPPFSPITTWPAELELVREFAKKGPTSGELGRGPTISGPDGNPFAPTRWFRFRRQATSLLVYADEEVPLNIGIVELRGDTPIPESLQADSTTEL